jgi:Family of unknown function (DUF5906)
VLSGALQVEWLAGELARLAPSRPYAEALHHADQIRGAWRAWYWRYDTFAHVIEGVEHLYARRVKVKGSTGTELKRLTVAVKGPPEEYSRGWEGTSGRTQRLVLRGWSAVPPPVIWRKFNADGELVGFERADFIAAHNYLAIDLATTTGRKCAHTLYRLLELIATAGAIVFVTEGEKDADRLATDLGVITTSADSSTWKPDVIEPLRGRDVIILIDNDATGQNRGEEAAKALHSVAASVRVVLLPGLGNTEDVRGYLDRNTVTADDFVKMCVDAPLWEPSTAVGLVGDNRNDDDGVRLENFYSYVPMHQYIFVPTRELWPALSVDQTVPPVDVGMEKPMRPSAWLDTNRAAVQMTWAPDLPLEIRDKIINDGGWIEHKGVVTLNLYRGPTIRIGDAAGADRWVRHVRKVYPDEAEHIIDWLAHRVQHPEDKINHALVLGGAQGIGKDTLLAPIKRAIGSWNFIEASPQHMLGRFNGFLRSVILRINEAHDLGGEVSKFAFYERLKAYTASPPEVLRVDEKNLREHSVLNRVGVILTSNHKVGGIYLPADDRRHLWRGRP